MRLPLGIFQQSVVAAYDPGMMTYDGSTGYYGLASHTRSASGTTIIARINRAAFTGNVVERILTTRDSGNYRLTITVFSTDYSDASRAGKVQIYLQDTASVGVCSLVTDVDICDGTDKVIFFAYDASGVAQLYVNGVDADDTGYGLRILTTGTMASGTGPVSIGSYEYNLAGSDSFEGDIGYVGIADAYLTNPTDFYHPTNGLQELDESGWTEWGAQPLFWNKYGQMTDNKGSAGNMTANGTITGPA